MKYFLSLEETWENCPRHNREVSQWLYYFESAWKSLKCASQLANVNTHPDEVHAFCERVRNEAALVTSVEWISRFPTVVTHDIDRLVLHAAILGCAQADALDMCVVSLTTGDRFPNPVITTMGDIQLLYTREVILYEERRWHLEKFACEHNEMLEGRQAIRDWVTASSQALANESPGLVQLARCTSGSQSNALVLGDESDTDGIGEDDLMLLPVYAIRADGEDWFREAAEAFHLRVATEAMLVALVNWVHQFLSVASEYTDCLVLHAAVLCRAQQHILNLYHWVILPPGIILDPFASVQDKIDVWLEHGAISLDEYSWHHALFDHEHDAEIRDWTAVLAPLLSQFAAVYHLPMITAATPDPSNDGPDYEEWLDFSSGDVVCGREPAWLSADSIFDTFMSGLLNPVLPSSTIVQDPQAIYDNTIQSLLALERSWLLCHQQNGEVTAWLCLFQSAWDAYNMSATLVQEDYHRADAERFRQKVVAKALPVASVDWIREYPSMSGMSAGLLATHAAAVLQAQRSVIRAFRAGVVLPGSIPHPLNIAKRKIRDHYDDSVSVTILGASGASHLLSALRAVAWPSPVPEESSGSVSAGENDHDTHMPESENEEGVKWYPEEDVDQ
ncbi:hypothetical protein EI94DRAFT_1817591 [Lactarius quietus]|nr:hypothetical protein EI94DRAFT_1817591 [Lactarius quietus]